VVTDGTGTRAALDFTFSAGKTGTSSGPNDVWFLGFTGRYVAGVWLGNDDNRPQQNGNTGGQLAAPIWQSFMMAAHASMDIPQIPGLPLHPVQVAEQQRLAEIRRRNPTVAAAQPTRSASIMPDATRAALKRVVQAMRNAGAGAGEPPGAAPQPQQPAPQPRSAEPERRAEGGAIGPRSQGRELP
jgi:penicillin-binding protein 1A